MKKSCHEVYHIKNDGCPICDEKFKFVTPIIRIDGKGYHWSCYEKNNSK